MHLRFTSVLAKIVETVTRLEYGTGFKRDVRLHRANRARTIYSSLAIEGNTLSLGEVTAVIDGKIVAGKQEEIKEVRNAYEAYDRMMTFDPYSVDDFLRAHRLMTEGLVAEAGRFRGGDVGVFDGGVAVHIGARPQFVPGLVKDLFRWAKESGLHPCLKSAILHDEIETIHPFADGNGRTGRLVEFYLLLRAGNPDIASHILSNHYNETRAEYYRQIQQAHDGRDLTAFIEYAVQGFRDGLLRTLRTIQANQFDITWQKLIYDRFAEKPYTKKSVFVRQRRLALALPRDRVLPAKRVMELTPAIARDYATLSEKTVQRDLEMLVTMGLARRSEFGYAADAGVLRQQVPVRRHSPAGTER